MRALYNNLKTKTTLNALTDDDIQKLWLPYVVYHNTDMKEAVRLQEGVKTTVTLTREGSFTRSGREEADDLSSAVDHIAFQVHDLEEILGRLQDNNVSFEKVTVPELGTTQIFFSDPDGIQIELNFDCQDSGIPT